MAPLHFFVVTILEISSIFVNPKQSGGGIVLTVKTSRGVRGHGPPENFGVLGSLKCYFLDFETRF